MRTSRKKLGNTPKVRSLTIQSHNRSSTYKQICVPVIKLCGLWLHKLGFTPEQRVTVTTSQKQLIIRLEEE